LRLLRRPRRALTLFLLLLLLVPGALLVRRFWALHELQLGSALLERYHPHEARPHLETCLRVCPDNRQALLLLARAARRAAILEAGDHYLEEYRRRHGPTEELALEEILQAAAKGEVDRVEKYCRKLVEEDSPAAPLALEAMVQGYFQVYRLGEGFSVLQVWLERQPDNTQALVFDAGLKALLLHYDEATAIYGRVLQLDPEHDTARMRLATLLMDLLKYAEALPHLERLRRRQPDNLAAAVLLARCLDHLGRQGEAIPLLEEVLARQPHFPPALAERARLALAQAGPARAEAWLREALAQEPGNLQLRYLLIQCVFQSGRHGEAEAERRRLVKLKADLDRLEKITTTEMQQRPHDPALHHEIGLILLEVGRPEEAVQWLHRALKESPPYVPAHRALAEYYQQVGNQEGVTYHSRFLSAPQPGRPAANPSSPP
jgi:predicted Zn-dependent protease